MRSIRARGLAARIQRAIAANSSNPHSEVTRAAYAHAGAVRLRGFATVPLYPSQAESSLLASDEDRLDKNASHLVCSNCSSPISNTKDLIFFKWRSGIHMSSMTQAPLQHLRADKHWDSEENAWKKCKLYCIKCNHSVGSIARVYNSDKILFKASDVAIQMPVHQSPMLSLSGYPSSMLGFSMWSELLLMLESQPHLKKQLDIRRVDNIRSFTAEKKEINTMLLLASDLKSLLDLVETHMPEMNYVNLLTALHRVAVLKTQMKSTTNTQPKFRFSVRSEAPEDDLIVDFPTHMPSDEKAQQAREQELTKRLWRLVDATEGLLNFGTPALQSLEQVSMLASTLWRLRIGRPSIVTPMALQTLHVVQDSESTFNFHMALIACATAHLASKDLRGEPWMRDLLFTVADLALAADTVFSDEARISENLVPLALSMALTGHVHEEFQRRVFDAVTKYRDTGSHFRLYQTHLDNVLLQRGDHVQLQDSRLLAGYKKRFMQTEQRSKNSLFRVRHQVASTLEGMKLQLATLHFFPELGYTVDLALVRERIAIELNAESAYLAHDPRGVEDEHDAVAIESGFRQRPYITTPAVDLKARHLERAGWIVVQLPIDEFEGIQDSDKRAEYMSMLIEIAVYTRAQQLEDEP